MLAGYSPYRSFCSFPTTFGGVFCWSFTITRCFLLLLNHPDSWRRFRSSAASQGEEKGTTQVVVAGCVQSVDRSLVLDVFVVGGRAGDLEEVTVRFLEVRGENQGNQLDDAETNSDQRVHVDSD